MAVLLKDGVVGSAIGGNYPRLDGMVRLAAGQQIEVRLLHPGVQFVSRFERTGELSTKVVVYGAPRDGKPFPVVLPVGAYRMIVAQCRAALGHERPWDLKSGPFVVISRTGASKTDTKYVIVLKETAPVPEEKAPALAELEAKALDYATQEEKWMERAKSGVGTSPATPQPTPANGKSVFGA